MDTAAYVPHHHLNLSAHNFKPDFAVISFYKLFGYPSGVGALLIRKDIEPLMSKTYFAGGSVFTATSGIEWHLTQPFPRILEDGTVPYLDILALRSGLEAIHSLGGIDRVHDHTKSLGQYLYLQLSSLKHSNGMPIVRVFGRWAEQEDIRKKGVAEVQGPTINFQLLNPSSDVLSYKHAEQLLSNEGLHIRSGCTCNPGACYSYLGILDSEVRDLAEKRAKEAPADWEDKWEWIDVEREVEGVRREVRLPLGSLRASLGYMSRWEDAHSLVDFINTTYRDQQVDPPTLEISADKIGSERRQLSFPGHQKELHHTCAC